MLSMHALLFIPGRQQGVSFQLYVRVLLQKQQSHAWFPEQKIFLAPRTADPEAAILGSSSEPGSEPGVTHVTQLIHSNIHHECYTCSCYNSRKALGLPTLPVSVLAVKGQGSQGAAARVAEPVMSPT